MKTHDTTIREPRGFRFFPSAQSLQHNGFNSFHTDGKLKGSTRHNATYSQLLPVTTEADLEDIDSFIQEGLNRLANIRSTRIDIKMSSSSSIKKGSKDPTIAKEWQDAIVDCSIELGDASELKDLKKGCHAEKGMADIVDKNHLIICGRDDEDIYETTYLPSSNGIQSSSGLSQKEKWTDGDISPTCSLSRASKARYSKSKFSYNNKDQWKTQPIAILSDKAIAYEFTQNAQLHSHSQGSYRYVEEFNDNEEFRGVTNCPDKTAVLSKGDWNPRDIKMCSPFKACRGETPKATKSAGAFYGEMPYYDTGRTPNSADAALDGIFVVTAHASDDEIETFEHLYKAEFDLLEERNEHVDVQEMEEWRSQAGLTADIMAKNRANFNKLLDLKYNYFGKRVYPYNGEFDSMASKLLHVLDMENNDLPAETADIGIGKKDLSKNDTEETEEYKGTEEYKEAEEYKETEDDTEDVTELITFVDLDASSSDYGQSDSEGGIGRRVTSRPRYGSNIHQVLCKESQQGYREAVSIGFRDALSDFHMMDPTYEGRMAKYQKQIILQPTQETIEEDMDSKAASGHNFLLKTMLRFPWLDFKEVGLPMLKGSLEEKISTK